MFDSGSLGRIRRPDLSQSPFFLPRHGGASLLLNTSSPSGCCVSAGGNCKPWESVAASATDGFSPLAFPSVAFIIYLQLL